MRDAIFISIALINMQKTITTISSPPSNYLLSVSTMYLYGSFRIACNYDDWLNPVKKSKHKEHGELGSMGSALFHSRFVLFSCYIGVEEPIPILQK